MLSESFGYIVKLHHIQEHWYEEERIDDLFDFLRSRVHPSIYLRSPCTHHITVMGGGEDVTCWYVCLRKIGGQNHALHIPVVLRVAVVAGRNVLFGCLEGQHYQC